MAELSKVTKQQHEEWKTIVRGGLCTFIEVGTALKNIRDSQSYKLEGFDSFEGFCGAEWAISKSYANHQINGAAVVETLSGYNCSLLPSHESLSRPLYPLLSDAHILEACWNEVVNTAPTRDGKPIITEKHVKDVVKQYRNPTGEAGTFATGYRILYVDPPWKYNDALIEGYGSTEHHYPNMSIMELCGMEDDDGTPVMDVARANSVMFMWVTSPMLEAAFEIVRAWDFSYKTSFVWDKVKHNYGHYNSVRHEILLICTRGSCTPDSSELVDSVQTIERTAKHSQKPEEFRQIIDAMYLSPEDGSIDRVELFARARVKGWDTFGNQVGNDATKVS